MQVPRDVRPAARDVRPAARDVRPAARCAWPMVTRSRSRVLVHIACTIPANDKRRRLFGGIFVVCCRRQLRLAAGIPCDV